MPAAASFALDSDLFNKDLYISILSLWLPTYPTPTSQFNQEDVVRWFALSPAFDEQVRNLGGKAISSIGVDHLTLPPFESPEADQSHCDEIARPFISHLDQISVDESSDRPGSGVPASARAALGLTILLD